MNVLRFLRRRTFAHGIRPPDHKQTAKEAIRRLPFASQVIVPLAQHIGRPAMPIVHPGQEVVRGEPIGKADGFRSLPVHAPVTGVVKDIVLMPTAQGPKTESVVIDVYPGASQQVLYDYLQDIEQMSPKEIIQAVQNTGMVGLGGAAFPTHVKMSIPDGHHVDTVIGNGCECEPFLTTDHRVMLENTEHLIKGMQVAMRVTGARRGMIAVEDNKLDAVSAIRAKLPPDGSLSVHALQTKYPQGAEKMVIKALLNREVPSGGLPSEVGASVYNVATLAYLAALLPQGRGLTERVVTIAGTAVTKPGNYLVAIGTPMRVVLEQLGCKGTAHEVILGGPMMGMSVASLDVPVTKGTSGILVFDRAHMPDGKPARVRPCIKCGACVEVCPMHLNPSQLGLLAGKREYEVMAEKFHLFDCFECGCCSYVCPCNIPLVQYFRIAKAINREKAN